MEMDAETLASRAQDLLTVLPRDGSAIGNVTVRAKIGGWAEEGDDYWTVRNYLLGQGKVRKGPGRGGSIALVVATAAPKVDAEKVAKEEAKAAEKDAARERALYPHVKTVIQREWAKDQGLDDAIVEIIAGQGRRETGGKWTRPDVVVVAVRTFAHLPGRFLEVITVEVKPQIDILGVFEAAAHSRVATRSYLMFPAHDADNDREVELLERLIAEARRFNVGVIEFTDVEQYSTWDTLWDPVRNEPNPEDLDGFLGEQLPPAARDLLRMRVR